MLENMTQQPQFGSILDQWIQSLTDFNHETTNSPPQHNLPLTPPNIGKKGIVNSTGLGLGLIFGRITSNMLFLKRRTC